MERSGTLGQVTNEVPAPEGRPGRFYGIALGYCSQREHHKKVDFQAKLIAFLKKHRIEYDPHYIRG